MDERLYNYCIKIQIIEFRWFKDVESCIIQFEIEAPITSVI